MTLPRKPALKVLSRVRIERYNISALPVGGLAEKMKNKPPFGGIIE
jgi:hypothetical protein